MGRGGSSLELPLYPELGVDQGDCSEWEERASAKEREPSEGRQKGLGRTLSKLVYRYSRHERRAPPHPELVGQTHREMASLVRDE